MPASFLWKARRLLRWLGFIVSSPLDFILNIIGPFWLAMGTPRGQPASCTPHPGCFPAKRPQMVNSLFQALITPIVSETTGRNFCVPSPEG